MFRPKITTIVFIGNQRIVRCDVMPRSARVRGIWSRPRSEGIELPGLVDEALRSGSGRPGRVWVLSSDFWIQDVALSERTTAELSREEIGRLLAFEVESLSGLSAVESDVGFKAAATSGRQQNFRVVQVPVRLRQQVDGVVRRTNGQFCGFAHPGGLPIPIGATGVAASQTGWLRVEAWPGSVLAVGAGVEGRLRGIVMQADSRGTAWRDTLENFRHALGPVDTLEQMADDGLAPPLLTEARTIELQDDDALAAWLAHWANVLSKSDAAIATIRPHKRPLSRAARLSISLSLATVVGGICIFDGWSARQRIAEAETLTRTYKQQSEAFEATKTSTAVIDKRIASHRAAVARVRKEVVIGRSVLSAYRTRWPRLLDALATHCPAQAAISAISQEDGKIVIHGMSINETAIDQLAASLATDLHPQGWFVAPPRKSVETHADRSPCTFSLELREKSIAEFSATGANSPPEAPVPAPDRTITQRQPRLDGDGFAVFEEQD